MSPVLIVCAILVGVPFMYLLVLLVPSTMNSQRDKTARARRDAKKRASESVEVKKKSPEPAPVTQGNPLLTSAEPKSSNPLLGG